MRRGGIVLLLGILAGCAPEMSGTPTVEWLGAEPHFVVMGTLHGEVLDLDLGTRAKDPVRLHCRRRYEAPLAFGVPDYARGRLYQLDIVALVVAGGEQRILEISFGQHDLQRDAAGAIVPIVPRDDTAEPDAGELWLEWGWFRASDFQALYRSAAQIGQLTLGEFTGKPGPAGLVIAPGEGAVGGLVDARWTLADRVTVSFTANCSENTVEGIR